MCDRSTLKQQSGRLLKQLVKIKSRRIMSHRWLSLAQVQGMGTEECAHTLEKNSV
ncbi:MAG: hypothetical protein HC790_05990 [Acaryochloridaceae cyanobacterium CSU_3_4]|nr:hypothetical protein [Acaryochloridaceae cyanobacterium CSU_3_4]